MFFNCIRCILQVSTYVLCFQHVFTIGIILSATERHNHSSIHLFQSNQRFQAIEFVDQPIPEKLNIFRINLS